MKRTYIAPVSTKVSYIEPLQPLCGSTTQSATHEKKTDEVWSNQQNWERPIWGANEDE